MQDQAMKVITSPVEGAEEENALDARQDNQGFREDFMWNDTTASCTPMELYAAKEAMAKVAANSDETEGNKVDGSNSSGISAGSDSSGGSPGPGEPGLHDESEGVGGDSSAPPGAETSDIISVAPEKRKSFLDDLRAVSLNEQVEELLACKKNAVFVAGRLALAGQVTVFYGGPNTGKTLITLHLLREAIQGSAMSKRVFHINLDDDFQGLIQKAELGNRYGFDVIGSDVFTSPGENFTKMVDILIEQGVAGEAVFVLDTVKKFVDVMDKKDSTAFMTTSRRLTAHGGTIIALAHVNKNPRDGVSVPGGTSDLLDDCDCAYVMDIVREDKVAVGIARSVEFTSKKSRGPTVNSATYTYLKNDAGNYEQMFDSVTLLDPEEADRIREENARAAAQAVDQAMISAVTELLKGGELNQGDIIATLTASHGFSRRKLTECLRRWCRLPEDGGLWQVRSGDRNSRIYYLTT